MNHKAQGLWLGSAVGAMVLIFAKHLDWTSGLRLGYEECNILPNVTASEGGTGRCYRFVGECAKKGQIYCDGVTW